MRLFTSDTHFNHHKDFLYKQRNLNSIEEHDRVIVDHINEIVKPDDELYHLGDLFMYEDIGLEYIKQINCRNIHVICGNHDTDRKISLYQTLSNIIDIKFADRIRIGHKEVMLTHIPMLIQSERNLYQLAGHYHTNDKYLHKENNCIHVELDAWNLYPVSEEEILQCINEIEQSKKDIDLRKSNNIAQNIIDTIDISGDK